jgi:hypothetical protein
MPRASQTFWVSRSELPSPSISVATKICPDLSSYLVAVGPAYGFGPTSSAGLRAGRYRQSGSSPVRWSSWGITPK